MDQFGVAKIKVIGVGGGGGNAVSRMQKDNIQGVELFVANTDKQAIEGSPIVNKIVLGEKLTLGLGAGGNPDQGKRSAVESEMQIAQVLSDTDMVFVAAGMGGGTGTGAAPHIAKIAKDMGILTVGVVTKPFTFEGNKRSKNALKGIEELRESVDSLIVIPNNKLLLEGGRLPMTEAFKAADTILRQSVQTITDIVSIPAYINLDFADVKSTLKDKGVAVFGVGRAKGEGKAREAALMATNSPLLEASINGCHNAIVNVAGGQDVTLEDFNEAIETINEVAGEQMEVIFGFSVNESLKDEIMVTLIATGSEELSANKGQVWQEPNPYSQRVAQQVQQAPVEKEAIDFGGFADHPFNMRANKKVTKSIF